MTSARLRRALDQWKNARRPTRIDPAGPGQESVWDYPRPPRVEPVTASVRVEFAGELIASTGSALRVLETASPPTFYLPPDDVRTDLLRRSPTRSICEWKGTASYRTVRVGERVAQDAAWTYAQPFPEYAELAGYYAFFSGRVDGCFVGDERVRPQPGGFYGGWITSDIVGPYKGDPGTEGW